MLRLVTYKDAGQLGNCLYRMANLIAFARENDFVLYDLGFSKHGYSSCFEATHRQPLIRYPAFVNLPFNAFFLQKSVRRIFRHLVHYGIVKIPEISDGGKEYHLDAHTFADLNLSFASLYGVHFCADALVRKHADYLRTYLVPKRNLLLKVKTLHEKIKQGAEVTIGVHIRRGDFKDWAGGRFFFPVDTYVRIMREVASYMDGKTVKFIVFGNGDESVVNSVFNGLDVESVCGSPVEDIYHLSLCDLMIGTMYSSFSGWASFWGKVPLLRVRTHDQPAVLDDFRVVEVLNDSFEHNEAECNR
jgi:hypothetical protein